MLNKILHRKTCSHYRYARVLTENSVLRKCWLEDRQQKQRRVRGLCRGLMTLMYRNIKTTRTSHRRTSSSLSHHLVAGNDSSVNKSHNTLHTIAFSSSLQLRFIKRKIMNSQHWILSAFERRPSCQIKWKLLSIQLCIVACKCQTCSSLIAINPKTLRVIFAPEYC